MTPNLSLSIPNALKSERPDDYYKNTATIEWPLGPSGRALSDHLVLSTTAWSSATAAHVAVAKEFVRFLVGEGGSRTTLTSPASACCRRYRGCFEQPFWLDLMIRTAWPR